MARRPHPHVAIPPGAAPPTNPSPTNSWSSYLLQSPPHDPSPSSSSIYSSSGYGRYTQSSNSSLPPRISLDVSSRPASRASSYNELDVGRISFPEAQLYRSSSQRSTSRSSPTVAHRATRSELTVSPIYRAGSSRPASFVSTSSTSSPEVTRSINPRSSSITGHCQFTATELSDELSDQTYVTHAHPTFTSSVDLSFISISLGSNRRRVSDAFRPTSCLRMTRSGTNLCRHPLAWSSTSGR